MFPRRRRSLRTIAGLAAILGLAVAAACVPAGVPGDPVLRITNNRVLKIRFLAGGVDFLAYDPAFDRYNMTNEAAADVIVELEPGQTASLALEPAGGGAATRDWFVQEYDTLMDCWFPGFSENNPEVNDFVFLSGKTYVLTVPAGLNIPDQLCGDHGFMIE